MKKRVIALLLVCCMVFSLVACRSNNRTAGIAENSVKVESSSTAGQMGAEGNSATNNESKGTTSTVVGGNTESNSAAGKTEQPSAADDVKLENLSATIGGNVETLPSSLQTNVNLSPKNEYNKGVVLVKVKSNFSVADLGELKYTSVAPLYKGAKWYVVQLADQEKTEDAVTYLANRGTFEKVDYDYVMKADAEVNSIDISGNTYANDLTYLDTLGVKKGWESNLSNGKTPGGSPDVVIAIIDTGVDYNHLDLRNNIWVNTAEIPNNGKDDDNNGYIDDINGWDCVGDDNDPMDDNGHGTHVAGIAAAENNKLGTVGIAYNCKIMVLKAGNSSGYFNNSDIAEAVQYAYMNGASVINMSFGGTSLSIAAEEALEDAYNQCVLVAAAGNYGLCNQPGCSTHSSQPPTPFYPASLQYVIGVMSCDAAGTTLSYFSNFDHYPFNNYEYDVVACGEDIQSTWPNNKYASLSGTSMACPTVAGIAAVVRSTFADREKYSTKFITSQIVSTVSQKNNLGIANLHAALTELPKPYIYNIYDQYIFDNVEFGPNNNGNGVIDAGETIRLAVELQNRGGLASNVVAKINTIRSDDPSLTDPYVTIVNDTVQFSDIGTYSVRDCGKIYDHDGNWIGTEKYFEFIVSDKCPNSYLLNINVGLTYMNGLDKADGTVYVGEGSVLCNVNRGYHLSGSIDKDTTFEADRLYIISSDVVIPEGITVTFKEGCEIQFYDNREYFDSPRIIVYGTLNLEGTAEKMVKVAPDEHHSAYQCVITNSGTIHISYMKSMNLFINSSSSGTATTNAYIADSYLQTLNTAFLLSYIGGEIEFGSTYFSAVSLERCYLQFEQSIVTIDVEDLSNSVVIGAANRLVLRIRKSATNNLFYSHSNTISGGATTAAGIEFGHSNYNNYTVCLVKNNIFSSGDNHAVSLWKLRVYDSPSAGVTYENNVFSKGYQQYASQVIEGYYDALGNPILDVYGSLANASTLWPYVVSVEMFDAQGNPVTTVGREEIKVRVTFNRPMDTTKDTFVTFGTIEPYADYKITGSYVSDTVWEGTYTLKAQIENGQNFLKVENACAAEDPTKVVFGKYQLHEFTIDTTAAMSMNLLAFPKETGIELQFAQDDYDTLLGYNIYRSTDKDGNFVKLNPTILLADENTFLDENAEPGKTYWYTYTVVLSDFTESKPAGKVQATAMDTMFPSLYHTPVNQGYENNNLVISCTASDNVGIQMVTLFYRTIGAENWKSITMSKQNDKYNATIFGSDVTLAGLEYYIVAADAYNTVNKGDAETPYKVLVKSADTLIRKGDVDGDGAVTAKDALMLIQCRYGDLILTDDQFKRADLDESGVLDSAEALCILQYINGKKPDLTM